ncbi:hypothetical protein [Bradyrhizobium sp. 76]|uniref:hypothetical protein n=1 Tax=Bradyrhizobium sp. 76 TaxID=2782680 RepID=UPI001FFAE695|nr:hypothetical protein [Bradyrhizobium sp. 76]MCK1405029.1 hypothetical protein [Bradyrhizobium sp. 76]
MKYDPQYVVGWMITALFFLGIAYVSLYGLTVYLRWRAGKFDGTDAIIRGIADDITSAMLRVWNFVRPILQLIIILFVIYWFSQTIGLTKESFAAFGATDIKTTLAFSVVAAFCLAAFLSDAPASWLKDIALVVIGFYFGSRSGGP